MTKIDFSFALEHQCSHTDARAGVFQTAHSRVKTPVFMPVATHAALRGQNIANIEAIGFQTLLANTYHLLLRPGVDVFRKYGGIHQFMGWPRSVLTDSGGFQLFSLSHHLEMSEEGAEFRSYIDGKKVLLTPEVSIGTQKAINSDIMMVLDQCIPALSDKAHTEKALHLTHRWAKRSLAARGDSAQALFGIVQGSCFFDLRRESAEQITELPFDGYAIGGVAVGEERGVRDEIVAYTAKLLPRNKPRYLMGVGTPIDLLEGVARGIDMFDCIIPTALAEQGRCFTHEGKINLSRGVYAGSMDPIEASCTCSTCKRHTRGYLHHLIKAGEFLGHSLLGIHNLTFYYKLMTDIREQIVGGTFPQFYAAQRELLGQSEASHPVRKPRPRRSRNSEQCGDYSLHRRGDFISVKQLSSGEVMHSVSDPLVEAEQLYVNQSRLRDRLSALSSSPIVVWDVGLGAATNAMAAVRAYEALASEGHPLSPLHIISFENDLDSLRLALKNPSHFPQVRHQAPHTLLETKTWQTPNGGCTWTLMEGDFLNTARYAPRPDLIFFDPFSYKTTPILWSLQCFEFIRQLSMNGRTELFTYSASTRVRAGLLAAGFYVAQGAAAGPKEDTTIGIILPQHDENAIHDQPGYRLLDHAWLARWERSQAKYPPLLESSSETIVAARIRSHPQFNVATPQILT